MSAGVVPPGPDADATYCPRCGLPAAQPHPQCAGALALEPPRYCSRCRRRMVVQVTPISWTARCVEHGLLTG